MIASHRALIVVAMTAVVASSMGQSKRPYSLPTKLERSGFQAGIWDVGACYVSGQPSEAAFRQLAKDGVKTVICLRGQMELDNRQAVPFDEQKLLKELGITFVHIPVMTDEEYSPAAVAKFAEALDKAEGKVLLHCTVGWRASYVWASYLHVFRNETLDSAVKTGLQMNMSADRVALMLGGNVMYEDGEPLKATKNPLVAPHSPKADRKLVLTSPKVIIAPSQTDFMAFVMWDMGDVMNSSQPDEKRLRDLASQGVKTIINIRSADEMKQLLGTGFDEEKVAKDLGLAYVHIPIGGIPDFTPANLDKFAAAVGASKGKVLVHCLSATRTSSLWAAYLVKYCGLTYDQALRHAEAMRLSNPLAKFLGKEIKGTVKAGGELALFKEKR